MDCVIGCNSELHVTCYAILINFVNLMCPLLATQLVVLLRRSELDRV